MFTAKMVRPSGFEPLAFRLGGGRSILLSYGRIFHFIAYGGDLRNTFGSLRMRLRYLSFSYRSSLGKRRTIFRNLRRRLLYPYKFHQYI